MLGKAAKQRRNRAIKRQAKMRITTETMQDDLKYSMIDDEGCKITKTGKEWKQIAEVFKRSLNQEVK